MPASKNATWAGKSAAIARAIRQLPIKPPAKRDGIPLALALDDLGRHLLTMTPIPRPSMLEPKKALRELKRASDRLLKALDSTPPEVLWALNMKPEAIRKLTTGVRGLQVSAQIAKPEPHVGAPQKIQPAKIAAVVGQIYYGLTGDKPTVPKRNGVAYGPFPRLLADVFAILDIKASAVSQAEKVARNWKPGGPLLP